MHLDILAIAIQPMTLWCEVNTETCCHQLGNWSHIVSQPIIRHIPGYACLKRLLVTDHLHIDHTLACTLDWIALNVNHQSPDRIICAELLSE
jgi:hypothetical protein